MNSLREEILSEVSDYLAPNALGNQDYWNQNISSIVFIPATYAKLVRLRLSLRNSKRHDQDAIIAILYADLAWQQIRALAGRSGNDDKWANDCYNNHLGGNDRGSKYRSEFNGIISDIKYVYESHTLLRHPKKLCLEEHKYFYSREWPQDKFDKLVRGLLCIEKILFVFLQELGLAGYEGEVLMKEKHIHHAINNYVPSSDKK